MGRGGCESVGQRRGARLDGECGKVMGALRFMELDKGRSAARR